MPASVHVQLDDALTGRTGGIADVGALRRLLARAARAALRRAPVTEGEVSITLLDDTGISALNQQYLGHDGPTDVISFPLYEQDEPVTGDVYIGLEQAVRQAAAHDVPLDEELVRLTVHGVLHVLGYDHPDGAERVSSEMWHVQEEIVARVVRG